VLEKAKSGETTLFFVDAAHMIHSATPSVVWSEKRLFVKACSGRKRFNVLGALNAVTNEMIFVSNDTVVNAWTLADLFKKIRVAVPNGNVSVILDNARYQKCYLSQIAANMSNIELIYLPPYSPNLNLIERAWKFVRKKCLNSKFHSTFKEHCDAITVCIKNFTAGFLSEVKELFSWNFQTFKNQSVMPR
jgi:transposase